MPISFCKISHVITRIFSDLQLQTSHYLLRRAFSSTLETLGSLSSNIPITKFQTLFAFSQAYKAGTRIDIYICIHTYSPVSPFSYSSTCEHLLIQTQPVTHPTPSLEHFNQTLDNINKLEVRPVS